MSSFSGAGETAQLLVLKFDESNTRPLRYQDTILVPLIEGGVLAG